MPFHHADAVRPSSIRPGSGIRNRTRGYQAGITLLSPMFPLFPLFVRAPPWLFTTTEVLGRAILRVAQGRANRFVLESTDINRVGA